MDSCHQQFFVHSYRKFDFFLDSFADIVKSVAKGNVRAASRMSLDLLSRAIATDEISNVRCT